MSFFNSSETELNRRYQEWQKPFQLKQIALINFITGLLYIILYFINREIAPKEILESMFVVEILLLPTLFGLIATLAYFQKFYKSIIFLIIFVYFVANTTHTYLLSYFDSYSIYHAELYLGVFWVFTVSGLNYKHATFTALSMVIFTIISTFYIDNLNSSELIMHFFWLSAAFSFGFTGAFLLHRSKKENFLNQEQLKQELHNRDILLRELGHRVKNNLQIVSSILHLQSKKVVDEEAKEILRRSIQTIKSMGLIHEKLYKSDNLELINFKEYLESLIVSMKQYTIGKEIRFDVECKDVMITLKSAVPLGLIVNEIIINSIKHAFNKQMSEMMKISIKVSAYEEDKICLEIADNGEGLKTEELKKNFGFKLIESLSIYQLKASINYFNMNGLCYVIRFEDKREGLKI